MDCFCITCGRKINTPEEKLWTDDVNGLSFSHGWYQCKECYSKDHKFCPKCEEQPMLLEWKVCPKCGTRIKTRRGK